MNYVSRYIAGFYAICLGLSALAAPALAQDADAKAAERTLNATEIAMPIQEKLSSEATQLSEKWKSAFEDPAQR